MCKPCELYKFSERFLFCSPCFLVQVFLLFASVWLCSCKDGEPTKKKEIIEILIWSGASWCGFTSPEILHTPNYLGHTVDKRKWNCPVDCRFTTNKERLGNVDGVLFEAQPLTSFFDDYKRDVPYFPQKYFQQKWINFGYETQFYFQLYENPGYTVREIYSIHRWNYLFSVDSFY